MNLVFGAEGLSVGEGAFLMACCNHTDARGYVIASMQQLADEAHMTTRAARDNKQRLIRRGLLKTAERFHPKNGAQIADLYRVNLDLLKEMQRKRTDYGPTLVEELTFDAPQETAGHSPPADSSGGAADSSGGEEESAGDGEEESAALLLPSSSPSSLSGDASVTAVSAASAGAVTEEREMGANQDHTAAAPAAEARSEHPVEVPEQRVQEQAVPSEAAVEFTAGLPGRLGRETVSRLAVLVDAAFLEGYTPETLRTELAGRVDVARIRSRSAVPGLYERALRDLPSAPAAQAAGLERCPDHPARYRDGCLDCALAIPA